MCIDCWEIHLRHASVAARPRVLLVLRDEWAVEPAVLLEQAASPTWLGLSGRRLGQAYAGPAEHRATEGQSELSRWFLASVAVRLNTVASLVFCVSLRQSNREQWQM